MKRKPIFTIQYAELEQMPTKQLLARLKRLRQCEESLAASDRDQYDQATPNAIEFKQTPQWAMAYAPVKEILARREHLPKYPRTQKGSR